MLQTCPPDGCEVADEINSDNYKEDFQYLNKSFSLESYLKFTKILWEVGSLVVSKAKMQRCGCAGCRAVSKISSIVRRICPLSSWIEAALSACKIIVRDRVRIQSAFPSLPASFL